MSRRVGQPSLPSLQTTWSPAPTPLPGIERKEKRFGKSIVTSGGSVISEKSHDRVLDKPRAGGLLTIPQASVPTKCSPAAPSLLGIQRKEKRFGKPITMSGGSVISEKSHDRVLDKPRPGGLLPIPQASVPTRCSPAPTGIERKENRFGKSIVTSGGSVISEKSHDRVVDKPRPGGLLPIPQASAPTRCSPAAPSLLGIERKEKRFGKSITTSGGSVMSEKSQECVLGRPKPGGLLPIPQACLPTRWSSASPPLPGIESKEKRFGKSIATSGGSVISEKSQECVLDKPRAGGLLPIPPLDSPQTLKMNPSDSINFEKKEKEKQNEKGIMKGMKGEAQELEKEVKRNMMQEIEQFSEESVASEHSKFSTEEVKEDIKKDIQQQPSAFNGGKYSSAPINEQQEKRPPTHDELDHMQSIIGNLQSKLEAKKKFASSLQQTVNQLNSDLKAERSRNEELQSSLKEAVCQQQKEAADFEYMSQANEELVSEINFLQNELEVGEKQWELGKKQFQEDAEARSRLEEALEKEEARYSIACKKIQIQKEESEDLRASFKAMETEYERLKSKCHTVSETQEEMMPKKNDSRLEEAIKKERAEKELAQAQVADLKKSQKDLQQTKDRLEVTIAEMTAEREEHKKVIEKLQWDLKVSSSLPNEVAERDRVNRAEINALKRLVSEQEEKSQQKDDEIESMLFNIQDLKSRIEATDNVVSSLQGTVDQHASDLRDERARNCDLQRDYEAAVCHQLTVDQYASDLRDERARNCDLQRDYEAAVCQQKKQAEELDLLTQKNQQLASDKKGLQEEQQTKEKLKVTISEMTAGLEKYESVIEKLQKDLEASSSLHKEAAKNDELHCAEIKALKELISQQQEKIRQKDDKIESMLSDIQNLKSSIKAKDSSFSSLQQTVDQCASDLRDERKRTYDLQRDYEAALCQQKKEAEIRSGLEEAIKKENDRFSNAFDKIKLQKKESADIRAQLKTMETAYERMKSERFLLSESQEEMARQQRTISESQCTITKLVNMLDELRVESETRQGKLQDKLKQERKRNSELQQKVDETSAALIKEKTMCEKHRVELKESLTKQIETLEEKHHFARALERAQYGFSQFQAQHLAKSNFQFGHISDTDFRLHQQYCSSSTPQ